MSKSADSGTDCVACGLLHSESARCVGPCTDARGHAWHTASSPRGDWWLVCLRCYVDTRSMYSGAGGNA